MRGFKDDDEKMIDSFLIEGELILQELEKEQIVFLLKNLSNYKA